MANIVKHKKCICVCFDNTNNNKFWEYTLYDDGTATANWGRVGANPKPRPTTVSKALSKWQEKTNPNNRPDKRYTEVKVAEGATTDVKTVQASSLKSIIKQDIVIKDPLVKELFDFLTDVNVHNITQASGGSITYDTSSAQFKTPLGVILPEMIAEARDLLDDISDLVVANDYSNRKFNRLLQGYLRLVPHDVGMSKISPKLIFPNAQSLQNENDLLDGLTVSFNDIQSATSAKGTKKKKKQPKLFDVTLDVMRDRDTFSRIKKYFNDTKLNMHVTSNYKVKKVYEVKIGAMNESYEKKCPGYRQSSFLLTKSLAEKPQVGINTQLNRAVADLIQFDRWDSKTIEQRQEMLTKLARKVWDIPVDSNEEGVV